jgi:hypothetical protein
VQPQGVVLPASVAAASEGPAVLYREGLQSGLYRPDPLQQVTVEKLQVRAAGLAEGGVNQAC